MPNPEVSQIEVDGDRYNIKDEVARNSLAALEDMSDDTFVAALIDLLYPVGSTKITCNNTPPFEYGTWNQIGKGCALVGVDPDSSIGAMAKAYGEDGNLNSFGSADAIIPAHTHTIPDHSHNHPHTHGPGSLTGHYWGRNVDDKKIPGVHGAVSYQYTNFNAWSSNGSVRINAGVTDNASNTWTSAVHLDIGSAIGGESVANKNYQPSVAVYIWERTA